MEFGIRSEVLNEIIELAKKHCLKELILFGSRARGDFRETSDIDLAAKGGNVVTFTLDLEETSTLLMFDVVNLDSQVVPELMESIKNEGIKLYEES